MRQPVALALLTALLVATAACGGAQQVSRAGPAVTTTVPVPEPTAAPATDVPPTSGPTMVTPAPAAPRPTAPRAPATAPPTTAAAPDAGEPVVVAYRVERRTSDEATAGFEDVVEATLSHPRGWRRAGFDLARQGADAPYLIVLAEGDEVDRLCLPYDTYGKYSCQNGPVVALNADRWRSATPKWTGDLPTFRQMLVNHEVGHLLGQKHPRPQCPRAGEPAPVMNQQSTELDGCLPNPWPLDWEVAMAARHDRPLAPGPDR